MSSGWFSSRAARDGHRVPGGVVDDYVADGFAAVRLLQQVAGQGRSSNFGCALLAQPIRIGGDRSAGLGDGRRCRRMPRTFTARRSTTPTRRIWMTPAERRRRTASPGPVLRKGRSQLDRAHGRALSNLQKHPESPTMPKPNSSDPAQGERATGKDLREILGDMDDTTALAILALHPSVAQIEEARIWLDGEGDILAKQQRPLDGIVVQIFDMLRVEEEEPSAKRV
jgi:hypothetical protein